MNQGKLHEITNLLKKDLIYVHSTYLIIEKGSNKRPTLDGCMDNEAN